MTIEADDIYASSIFRSLIVVLPAARVDKRSIVQLPAVPQNPSKLGMISIKDDARGLERTDCAKPRPVVLTAHGKAPMTAGETP
jgi:hypothetical protein